MKSWVDKHVLWLLPLLSLIVFFPTYKYGFVTDFLSWLYIYEAGSWSDLKDCFGYPGLHHFFHLLNFSLFKTIGKSFFGWYSVMAFLHGLNGFILYAWLKKMNQVFKLSLDKSCFYIIVVLFLLSPYSIEPVVWKACLHYLVSLGLTLSGLFFLTEYLNDKRGSWKVHVCFVLALFTLEISLAVPFIYLAYWITYLLINQQSKDWIAHLIRITLPQLLVLAIYFLLNKWVLGDWVGHYGAEKHLNMDLLAMSSNGLQNLGKYLLLLHYFPSKIKMPIYEFISNPFVIGMLILSFLLIGYIILKSKSEIKNRLMVLAFSFLAFFMGLFPISNLFFIKLFLYENDRYGYLASVFIYVFIGLLFWMIKRKAIRNILLGIYLSIHLFCFFKTIYYANIAGKVSHGLVQNFDFYDRDNIVFLSNYENIKGLQMFRDYSGKSLSFLESIDHFIGKKYKGQFQEIAQINITNASNKVVVEVVDSLTLKIKNPNMGSWFWKDGLGLTNYEDEEYQVELNGWYYLLKLKKPSLRNRSYIYNDGIEWKEVAF